MSIMGYLVPGRNEISLGKVEIDKDIRVAGPVFGGQDYAGTGFCWRLGECRNGRTRASPNMMRYCGRIADSNGRRVVDPRRGRLPRLLLCSPWPEVLNNGR